MEARDLPKSMWDVGRGGSIVGAVRGGQARATVSASASASDVCKRQTQWRAAGYEVIVTADHGQDERGHHGGRSALQQEAALYYFGEATGPSEDTVIDQLQLAPTILSRLGAPIPDTMKAKSFLS